jgi:hypothetical protein
MIDEVADAINWILHKLDERARFIAENRAAGGESAVEVTASKDKKGAHHLRCSGR